AVRAFVVAGGTLSHGPHCPLAGRAFGIAEQVVEFDCIQWREALIPHGWSTVAFQSGKALATYVQSGQRAIVQTDVGAGRVFSFGFQYGYSYSRRTMPIVPPAYGRREMHPVVLLKQTPIADLAGTSPLAPIAPSRGLEQGRFGNALVVVNHRSSPLDIRGLKARRVLPQVPCADGWLAAHSAMD